MTWPCLAMNLLLALEFKESASHLGPGTRPQNYCGVKRHHEPGPNVLALISTIIADQYLEFHSEQIVSYFCIGFWTRVKWRYIALISRSQQGVEPWASRDLGTRSIDIRASGPLDAVLDFKNLGQLAAARL